MFRSVFLLLVVCGACAVPDSIDEKSSKVFSAGTTVVALTFDDTFADNYQVGDLAAARGLDVTFFVNSGRLGLAGYMTKEQVLALQQQGHEIGGHTISHTNLTTDADAQRQVCNDRAALLDAGLAVTSFAYPFGANNATVNEIPKQCGYNSARDVGGLVTPGSCNGCPYANTIPPAEPYSLRTSDSVNSTTTLATMQEYVQQAERTGGGFVPIVFHHVCDGCETSAVSPAVLASFMDWLAARVPTTQVATVNDVIGGTMQPAVVVEPPPVDPPPASNLLRNPSLETDADQNQVPDCWQRGGTGTNTSTFTLVNGAYDGSVAQQITITSWSSGARRLVSAQDLGTCAPAITPGHAYTMTAYYQATTQPRFTVYYRNANGAWVWFAQSPLLPTSSTYRQATYTTPALPSDATAISLGLSIFNVGTITLDAHTLVDASADTTSPTLAITCNGTACSSTAYAGSVTVALAATDSDSGVKEVRYTTDGSDPTNGTLYTAPFSVSASSTVRATAVDNAGNRTAQSTSIVITPSTEPPPPTNLLQNASLEVDADGNQVPDCWRRDGYGTNTATFTLVSDAFDGAVAQRLDITSWSSGGRRLASAQDSGACAPAATPGRAYTVTAYYKATAQPRMSVFYRTTAGTWKWFAESPLLPVSSSYRQTSYTTPVLPADATAISVGLSIFSVGSLTSDAYTLVEVTP